MGRGKKVDQRYGLTHRRFWQRMVCNIPTTKNVCFVLLLFLITQITWYKGQFIKWPDKRLPQAAYEDIVETSMWGYCGNLKSKRFQKGIGWIEIGPGTAEKDNAPKATSGKGRPWAVHYQKLEELSIGRILPWSSHSFHQCGEKVDVMSGLYRLQQSKH